VRLLRGDLRALAGSVSGLGVLAAVVASVRVAPGATAQQVAARIRPAGRLAAGDVDDALVCLRVIGVVREDPAGRWSPGPVTLDELPVPLAELESLWARERQRRRAREQRHR